MVFAKCLCLYHLHDFIALIIDSLTFSAPADKYVEWKFGDNQGKLKQYYRRNKTDKKRKL